MAAFGSLNVTVRDYKGKTAIVKVTVPTARATETNAKKIADFVKIHSDAQVIGYGYTKEYTGDSTDTGKYDRVLQSLRFILEDSDGNNRRFSIPAPRDESVNEDQEAEDACIADVLAKLAEVSGNTFSCQKTGVVSRLPKLE